MEISLKRSQVNLAVAGLIISSGVAIGASAASVNLSRQMLPT